MARGSVAHEVDKTTLDVDVDQFDMDAVAYFQTVASVLQSPFCRRLEEPNPRLFVRCTGDNAVESLA